MKGKQSVNELKYRLNIVTSSLFDGRNIKCHLAFTVCNALPSCCATYEQKTWKEMNKAEEKRGRWRGDSILFFYSIIEKKSLVPALAFIYHHIPMIYKMCSTCRFSLSPSSVHNSTHLVGHLCRNKSSCMG
jgi:hypothetical protein